MSTHIRLITPPGASYDGVTAVDLDVIPFTVAAGTERRDYLLPGNLGILLGDSLPGLGTGPGGPGSDVWLQRMVVTRDLAVGQEVVVSQIPAIAGPPQIWIDTLLGPPDNNNIKWNMVLTQGSGVSVGEVGPGPESGGIVDMWYWGITSDNWYKLQCCHIFSSYKPQIQGVD